MVVIDLAHNRCHGEYLPHAALEVCRSPQRFFTAGALSCVDTLVCFLSEFGVALCSVGLFTCVDVFLTVIYEKG